MINSEKEVENLIRVLLSNPIGADFKDRVFSVGGFVRDDVLGIESKDLDIVVEIEQGAEKLAQFLHSLFPRQISKAHQLGAHYPIWHLHFKDDIEYQNIIFKTCGSRVDFADTQIEMFPDENSRQRVSSFGNLNQDIQRRDFTVNMLLRSLTTGELLDLSGVSLQDIQNGILRGHPDVSLDKIFKDDPLRMLRLIRFQAQFNWMIPEDVLECVQRNASRMQIVSSERINTELTKIMNFGKIAQAIKLMDQCDLLKHIFPEVFFLKGVEQDIYYHSEGDVFIHTLLVAEKAQANVISQLSALLHDIGKPDCQTYHPQENSKPPRIKFLKHEVVGAKIAESMLRKLKFDLDTIAKVKKIILFHLRALTSLEWSDKALRKFIRDCGEELESILHMSEIDILSSFGPNGEEKENIIPQLRERIKKTSLIPVQQKTILNGNDIIKLLGISGVQIKFALELLQEIEDEYAVEGRLLSRDEAMIELKQRYKA